MTAAELIDILNVCAANSEIPLDELYILVEDVNGWPHTIDSYDWAKYNTDTIVLKIGE